MRIGTAGNTGDPSLCALKHQGYVVTMSYQRESDGRCSPHYTAAREGRLFMAESPEALLGLVAMWEVRGDDWRAVTVEERAWCDSLRGEARIYDDDGNDVTDDED